MKKSMEIIRQCRGWLARELSDTRRQAFQIIAAVTTLFLLAALVEELLFKESTDAKIVGVLVASLLASAFLASFGKEVAGRIRKIGPIEIVEAQKAIYGLDEIDKNLQGPEAAAGGEIGFTKVKITPAQEFYFEEAVRILSYLKLSGSEPESGAQREIIWELLRKVGLIAMSQAQPVAALHWLEHLEKSSGCAYRADEVSGLIGIASFVSALVEEDPATRAKRFKKTAERLAKLARKGALNPHGYFCLAYAQDELGRWYEAVGSNLKALERRPRFAQARFNLAVSLLKLGRAREACEQLKNIRPQDQDFAIAAKGAADDEEIKTLVNGVENAAERDQLRAELDRLSGARLPHPNP